MRMLSPVIIVEYDRIPYVYSDGNVRVTMDRNICGSVQTEMFMETKMASIPILETGYHLLEIKYDEYLPDVIVNFLDNQLSSLNGEDARLQKRRF